MKFKKLAQYFERIEKTASRLAMTEILAELFEECSVNEIDLVTYLALGKLRPKFEGIEFNMAETMMLRVISVAYGVELEKVEKEFKKVGDLGGIHPLKLAKKLESKGYSPLTVIGRSQKTLSVSEVYKRLFEVAVDEGSGSQDRKVQAMAGLLKDLDSLSAKFVVRIPVNKLRLGFSDMTVLDALSWMKKGDKSLRPQLERPFNVSADIGKIVKVFKKKGLEGVARIKIEVGVPIRAAQAERLPNAEKMVEKLGVFGVEGKWDGLRVQIHVDNTKRHEIKKQEALFGEAHKKFVRIFSRNLDNMTHMFPDIVEAVEKLNVERVILDGEAVAYDPKTNKLLNFQATVKRKRKHGVSGMVKELPMRVFVYDILFLDGENLIEKPFKERRKKLEGILESKGSELALRDRPNSIGTGSSEPTLVLAEQEIVSDVKHLRRLVKKYLGMGLEGVMCKKLTTVYQAGSRNFNWVKFKKTTEGELVDTIDAVVMGYYPGKGRRGGFGIGAFLVGVPVNSPDGKAGFKIGSIAKIGTGVTDEEWGEIKKRCDKLVVKDKPEEYVVDKNLFPDVWVKPEMVVEIMADEITKSPIHAFGLALRFPRLVRFRDDKKVSQATSKKELEKFFKMQKVE
ncbi:MAG: ATP-dependent DNA ligase [Candidatus Beckwithbacteria bacterium]|nr:ATP-dependent DNA ligase [Patescibacteria group bacterium]